jgi:hypothetical protein
LFVVARSMAEMKKAIFAVATIAAFWLIGLTGV